MNQTSEYSFNYIYQFDSNAITANVLHTLAVVSTLVVWSIVVRAEVREARKTMN